MQYNFQTNIKQCAVNENSILFALNFSTNSKIQKYNYKIPSCQLEQFQKKYNYHLLLRHSPARNYTIPFTGPARKNKVHISRQGLEM